MKGSIRRGQPRSQTTRGQKWTHSQRGDAEGWRHGGPSTMVERAEQELPKDDDLAASTKSANQGAGVDEGTKGRAEGHSTQEQHTAARGASQR